MKIFLHYFSLPLYPVIDILQQLLPEFFRFKYYDAGYRDRHSYQQLAGAWLSQFHDDCRQKNFSLSDYLVKLAGGDEKKN